MLSHLFLWILVGFLMEILLILNGHFWGEMIFIDEGYGMIILFMNYIGFIFVVFSLCFFKDFILKLY
jgi:hypothetical protein